MDMSVEFIIITALESLLVILLIAGFVREGRIIRYELEIHRRLKDIAIQCREIVAQLYSIMH